MEEQKQETKEQLDQGKHRKMLRERDVNAWVAAKKSKAARRLEARTLAKSKGFKLGRWRGGVAYVKRPVNVDTGIAIGRGRLPKGFIDVRTGTEVLS